MDYIKDIKAEYENFSIALKNGALNEQEQFEKEYGEEDIESKGSEFNIKLTLLGDRESLVQMLETSKEFFDQ